MKEIQRPLDFCKDTYSLVSSAKMERTHYQNDNWSSTDPEILAIIPKQYLGTAREHYLLTEDGEVIRIFNVGMNEACVFVFHKKE